MADYKLISSKTCPFVQRAVITLKEKGVDFDIEYVDLGNKPDWFLALSPTGKVPLLQLDDDVLFESQVICEFLDEVADPQLHPADPVEKAKQRAWIEFIGGMLPHQFRLSRATDAEAADAEVKQARAKFEQLEAAWGDRPGPFWGGDSFTILDAAMATVMLRFSWIEEMQAFGLLDGLPNLQGWREALLARDSVQNSLLPEVNDLYRSAASDFIKQAA